MAPQLRLLLKTKHNTKTLRRSNRLKKLRTQRIITSMLAAATAAMLSLTALWEYPDGGSMRSALSVPAAAEDDTAQNVCGEGLTWQYTPSTHTLTIQGTGGMTDWRNGNNTPPPWWSLRTEMLHVKIADGVTSIGKNAFEEFSSLTSVEIPGSVTSIGEDAFRECYQLTDIQLPKGVECIGKMAFYSCKGMKEFTIPDSVTEIGEGAFWGC